MDTPITPVESCPPGPAVSLPRGVFRADPVTLEWAAGCLERIASRQTRGHGQAGKRCAAVLKTVSDAWLAMVLEQVKAQEAADLQAKTAGDLVEEKP